jgi:arginyl-tRNA synthetase
MLKTNPFLKEIAHHLKAHTGLEEKDVYPLIDQPPNPDMGDYTLPCYPLKERLHKPPNLIAQELAQALVGATGWSPLQLITGVKAEGAYLNFFVKHDELARWVLERVHKEGNGYGHTTIGKGKTVVIDYSSPNIAKHLAVHHLRSAVIGNALYRLYKALGYHCIGINHLGDWGTQFGQLIVAYRRWGNEEALKEDPVDALHGLYVKFHQEAKSDASLEDQARLAFKELEAGDTEAGRLWGHFKEVSLKEFNKVYRALGIKFDYYTGESFYNEMLNDTVERLKKAGLATLSEEALVVNLEQYGMPPCLLKKKDEASLYATRDVCAAEYRAREFGFSRMLYVVGSEQRLHFKQFFKVLELMGYPWVKDCVHVDFGLIKFKEGKMSTRAGRIILLEEVLKEAVERARGIIQEKNPDLSKAEEIARQVGIGAVIFADLSSRRTRDVLFDWKEVLNFDGETGPYLQYTHARLCSVIRKYGKPAGGETDFSLLKEKDEYLLVRKLESFPRSIVSAAETYEPVVLCNYLIELASIFNRYYNHHRIISKNEELTGARVLLADCTRQVLRNGLHLLGMETPEEM